MKCTKLNIVLHRIRYVTCCAFIASSTLSSTQLRAKALSELRLFHEPMQDNLIDPQLDSLSGAATGISEYRRPIARQAKHSEARDSTAIHESSADHAKRVESRTYQYNGFITGVSGQRYLINGVSLTELDTLVLVSAKNGGRSLVLKTTQGEIFELSIGQTINGDSL